MTQLTLGYGSNWREGRTWRTSQNELASKLGVSKRYVRDALGVLSDGGWLSVARAPRGRDATVYQLTLHNCTPAMTPTDNDGEPCTFAVPRGAGGLFERLFSGKIDWKSALVWLSLKLKSDWQTGETDETSISALAKRVGLGKQTVCAALKSLVKAGMLKRLSEHRWMRSVFQLFPRPRVKKKKKKAPRQLSNRSMKTVRRDGQYVYSGNEKYRLDIRSEEVYHKPSRKRGIWKQVRHERRHEIPLPIQRAFKEWLTVWRQLKAAGLTGD